MYVVLCAYFTEWFRYTTGKLCHVVLHNKFEYVTYVLIVKEMCRWLCQIMNLFVQVDPSVRF
jgi:hypothetical protein